MCACEPWNNETASCTQVQFAVFVFIFGRINSCAGKVQDYDSSRMHERVPLMCYVSRLTKLDELEIHVS